MTILKYNWVLISFLIFSFYTKESWATKFKNKIDNTNISFSMPKSWKRQEVQQGLFLVGPKNRDGFAPIVMVSPTGKNIRFNFKILNSTKEMYYYGRKNYVRKKKERFIARVPLQYQNKKKSQWYEVGYIARGKNYYREEVSKFMSCQNKTFNIKSLYHSKKKRKKVSYLQKIRKSFKCI